MLDDHGQGLIPRLARWELDLALIYEHEALGEPDVELERTHLLEDPFDLVVPDGHPLAGRASVALEELAEETWIGGAPDSAYEAIVRHSCRAAGFDPRVAFGSDDYNAVQAFVAVGLGISMLPHLALISCAQGCTASVSPSRPYDTSPPPGWQPATAPPPLRRCSTCSRRPLTPSRASRPSHRRSSRSSTLNVPITPGSMTESSTRAAQVGREEHR